MRSRELFLYPIFFLAIAQLKWMQLRVVKPQNFEEMIRLELRIIKKEIQIERLRGVLRKSYA